MSPAERVQAAKKAASARWDVPQALHAGELEVGDLKLSCYVLDDERRVFSRSGILDALGMKDGGQGNTGLGNDRLVRFVHGRAFNDLLTPELESAVAKPFRFRLPSGSGAHLNDGMALGYEATILVELCSVILTAREQGRLHRQQEAIAQRAEVLVRGFAAVGVVALVDEATGYQYSRSRRALAEILERFIAKELAQWAKTFDDEFYKQLFRLRRLDADELGKRPQYFGGLTNNIVYSRLAPGVLDELRKKNPRGSGGARKSKHHQWLTPEHGHPKLREHLAVVQALMKISPNYDRFIEHLDRVCPPFQKTLHLFSVEAMDGGDTSSD